MTHRFRRDAAPDHAGPVDRNTTTMTESTERLEHGASTTPAAERPAAHEGTVGARTMAAVRERQRAEFGGIAWGSAFFGWLSAMGLAALLTGLLSAAGAVLALSTTARDAAGQATIGIGAGIAFLAVVAVSYFAGGYVAGRMARFDGARQGLGVVAWAIVAAAILAIAGLIGGSDYNVLSRLNLPRLPIDEGALATGGAIALAAGLVVMVLAAMLGGKTGERFHRKVDRLAIDHTR
jgi:hypothetical protein